MMMAKFYFKARPYAYFTERPMEGRAKICYLICFWVLYGSVPCLPRRHLPSMCVMRN
ncbi:hypothetical protein RP20_CCG004141 [Aedes albopictus]|nr:hypothetical protein RP20_CCG004141 [Aedes albopictus]